MQRCLYPKPVDYNIKHSSSNQYKLLQNITQKYAVDPLPTTVGASRSLCQVGQVVFTLNGQQGETPVQDQLRMREFSRYVIVRSDVSGSRVPERCGTDGQHGQGWGDRHVAQHRHTSASHPPRVHLARRCNNGNTITL